MLKKGRRREEHTENRGWKDKEEAGREKRNTELVGSRERNWGRAGWKVARKRGKGYGDT